MRNDSRAERFKKAFGVDCSHAAGTGCCNGLAIMRVLHIPGCKYTGNIGGCSMIRQKIAGAIYPQLAGEERGVWVVADRQKESGTGQVPDFSGDDISDADTGHDILSKHIFDDTVPDKGNFFIFHGPVLHDFGSSQLVTTVNNRHFGGELGEKRRLLHRTVSAAYDNQFLTFEEKPVAGRAA